MSIFSKIVKGIGKGVGFVAKTAVNVAGNVVGVGTIIGSNQNTTPTSGGQVVVPAVAQTTVPTSPTQKGFFGQLGDAVLGLLNGNNHIEVDHNVSVDASKSQLPNWLLPVGLGAGLLFMLNSRSGGRR